MNTTQEMFCLAGNAACNMDGWSKLLFYLLVYCFSWRCK